MMRLLSIVLCMLYISAAAQKLDPKNTYAFIVGVLKWNDKSLAPFSADNRQDKALQQQFTALGIPDDNIVTLLDEKASLKTIQQAFVSIGKKCNANTTFIFYYAGHGIKRNQTIYFANHDIDVSNCAKTGLALNYLSTELLTLNKANNFIFLADCCYSGGLLAEAKKINEAGRNAIAITSATASNTSTGNWTFTLSLIEALQGKGFANTNNDNTITTKEISNEVQLNMKTYERQLSGYYSSHTTDFGLATIEAPTQRALKTLSKYAPGDCAYAFLESRWQPIRIVSLDNNANAVIKKISYSCFLYDTVNTKQLKPCTNVSHSLNAKINVMWEGKTYPASILKKENDFYYIQYDGYDESWNEWVMYDRIRTGKELTVLIEDRGKWYQGIVFMEKEKKYFVHYNGYDYSWDEWVGINRIKFK